MAKKTIDLQQLLESKLGDIRPTESDIRAIETASRSIPENLLFSAESTEFKPVTKPTTVSGSRAKTVDEAKQYNADLDRFIDEVLIPNVDYGIIASSKKPTLLKSGAEKLMNYLGLISRVEVVNRVEDYQGQGFFAYEVKSFLIDEDGIVRGEGIATGNTKESRYAKQSAFSCQNVVLKIAFKRAIVASVLATAGVSARFTQDLEDMDLPQEQEGKNLESLKKSSSSRPATKKQLQYLLQLMEQHNNSVDVMNKYCSQIYGVDDYTKLSGVQVSELIEKYKALE